MATTLNGLRLFDEQDLQFEISSCSRDTIEKSVGGLDGVVSFDLGKRSRVIKQKGTLRAASKNKLTEKTGTITDYMDGYAYTLVTNDGQVYENMRIDAFKTCNERTHGSGVAVDYEIIYTQLVTV